MTRFCTLDRKIQADLSRDWSGKVSGNHSKEAGEGGHFGTGKRNEVRLERSKSPEPLMSQIHRQKDLSAEPINFGLQTSSRLGLFNWAGHDVLHKNEPCTLRGFIFSAALGLNICKPYSGVRATEERRDTD